MQAGPLPPPKLVGRAVPPNSCALQPIDLAHVLCPLMGRFGPPRVRASRELLLQCFYEPGSISLQYTISETVHAGKVNAYGLGLGVLLSSFGQPPGETTIIDGSPIAPQRGIEATPGCCMVANELPQYGRSDPAESRPLAGLPSCVRSPTGNSSARDVVRNASATGSICRSSDASKRHSLLAGAGLWNRMTGKRSIVPAQVAASGLRRYQ